MSIVRWNPWREFDDLFTNMAALPSENLSRSEWVPAVDISETDAPSPRKTSAATYIASTISLSIAS